MQEHWRRFTNGHKVFQRTIAKLFGRAAARRAWLWEELPFAGLRNLFSPTFSTEKVAKKSGGRQSQPAWVADPQFGIVAWMLTPPRSVPHWNCVPLHPPQAARYSVPPIPPWHSMLCVAIIKSPAKIASQGRSCTPIGASKCPAGSGVFVWLGFAVWLRMGLVTMVPIWVMELVPVILMVVTEVARAVSMPFWRSRQAPRRAGHLACSKFLIVAGPKGIQRPTEKPFCRAVARPPAPHAHEPMTKDPAPCCETGVERGEAPLRGCRGRAPRPGFRRAAPFGGGVEGRTPNRAPGAAPLVSDAACFPACGGASAERRS